MIPDSHRRALGQRLDRDGRVEFKNGSIVTVEAETDLRISWPDADETAYVNDCAHDQLDRAYTLAMVGSPPLEPPPPPRPKRQPSGDGSKFGDDPPF